MDRGLPLHEGRNGMDRGLPLHEGRNGMDRGLPLREGRNGMYRGLPLREGRNGMDRGLPLREERNGMDRGLPLPEGRRSALARDLARSGSQPVSAVCQREQRAAPAQDLCSRQIQVLRSRLAGERVLSVDGEVTDPPRSRASALLQDD